MKLRWAIPVLCATVIGCSSGSGGSNTSNAVQPGQWEFVATPDPGGSPFYLEANLTASDTDVSSTVFNTLLFEYGGAPIGPFLSCGNADIVGSISNGVLTGSLNSAGSSSAASLTTFSGARISSNGKSVAGGSYSAGSLCGGLFASSHSAGTFTGYTVSPLNGTFVGILTGSCEEQVTIQISQDSNFDITVTGTSAQPGVTSNLSISPGSPSGNIGGYSNIIGATVEGSGTETNVNGTFVFGMFGHFNPAATQVTISNSDHCGTESGTLTRQ